MLRFVLKRMSSSRWMILCLLIGSIIATALVSSIPTYTDGIFQRMLTKDLENYQLDTGTFPGTFQVKEELYFGFPAENRTKGYLFFTDKINKSFINQYSLPILSLAQDVRLGNLSFQPGMMQDNQLVRKTAQLGTISGLEDHIKITNGKLYSSELKDGVIDVMVSEAALRDMDLIPGREYLLSNPIMSKYTPVCKIRVTGVFTKKDSGDAYWPDNDTYGDIFLMDYKLFNSEFISKGTPLITTAKLTYAFDYHKITIQNLPSILGAYNEQSKWYKKYGASLGVKMPAIDILNNYGDRYRQLRVILWVLTIPVLLMLMFYIFMVSQILIKHDENSIAVLKSRGASRSQILRGYLYESTIIGITALVCGPPLGMVICSVLGASNGFLEFVTRTALPLKLGIKAYGYSLAAAAFLVVTMMIPAFVSSRMNIVNYKREKSRGGKAAIWKKYFLDIVILALSAFGLYGYFQHQKILQSTGVQASSIQIDPLLFLSSSLFVLGLGLLFLRFYPLMVRLIFWIGRRIWSPVFYISLIQVGRSRGQEQFLMLFIIIAISTGIFNANSARTINTNMEDRIRYTTGADVTLMAHWKSNLPDTAQRLNAPVTDNSREAIKYFEPDYHQYSTLAGTELATKVFIKSGVTMQTQSGNASGIKLMGIIPDQFAKVSWLRPDLLKPNWINYLNLIVDAPRGLLLSSNLREKYGLKPGDTVYLNIGDNGFLEGMVYAFVDYWPTYNPNPPSKGQDAPGLVVANLSYIQAKTAIQPYQVWIRKKPGAADGEISDDILKKQLYLDNITFTNQQLIKMKNDPLLQGTNGALTLGFVSAMLISLLGFLFYWIISIRNRVLQFGILRAMGLSLAKVVGMLACEQILVSVAAIVMGIIIGGITGDQFIPFLQLAYNSAEQVPPFKIVAFGSDYIKIYVIIAFMLLVGFATLWRLIAQIRIDQAVKLGED